MKSKIISGLLTLFGLYLIVSFSRSIFDLYQKSKEIEKERLKVEALKIKNEELKKQLEYVRSQEFLEKEAREKLGLVREGEVVVILPENFKEAIGNDYSQTEKDKEVPNWEKWWKVFF